MLLHPAIHREIKIIKGKLLFIGESVED